MLFEDLAVYFSQEECVSLHPAQRSLSREATQECFKDKALIGNTIVFPVFWNFLGLGLHSSSTCWYGKVGPILE